MLKKSMLVIFLALFAVSVFAAEAGEYYNYGISMFKKGDYKKAEQYLSQAVKLDPRNPAYYSALAACYKKTGKAAMAKKYEDYAQAMSRRGGAAAAFEAKKINAEVFAGFTTASMAGINSQIDYLSSQAKAAGSTATNFKVGGAFMAGAQGGYSVLEGLYVGPRFEYVGVFSVANTATGGFLAGTVTYGASLFDILAGASYKYPLKGVPLTLSGDLYLGYGAAGVSANTVMTAPLPGTVNAEYSGGAFAADFTAGGNYKISDSFSAGLSLGYRLANAASVTANEDNGTGFLSVKKGDVLADSSGNTLAVDFSGLIVSLNADFAF